MRIFKTRQFDKWARKHSLNDIRITEAVHEISNGLIDTDYGNHLYKKRVATKGRGKSGSVRTLLACNLKTRAFCLYGFEKGERDNINDKEKAAYKLLAKAVLALTAHEIARRLHDGSLIEVKYEQDD